jgi:hypothetical protein
MKVKKKFFVRMAKWMAAVLIVSAVTVTSQSFVYADETYTIAAPTITTSSQIDSSHTVGGNIYLSSSSAAAGSTVVGTYTANDGYYLAQVRYAYIDGSGNTIYNAVEPNGSGGFSFTMPSSNVTVVKGDFVTTEWDGTIDVTWYNPAASSYSIKYAAELAGVAAITNGIFNNYPLTPNSSGNYVPNVNTDGTPYGSNEELYNIYKLTSSSTDLDEITKVVGDISNVLAGNSTGDVHDQNQVTTTTYWFGGTSAVVGSEIELYPTDFTDKIVNLTADVDMGGDLASGTSEFVLANWAASSIYSSTTSPNYMPIGGQYLIYNSNGYTHLGSSFNGTFDGHGHIVDNIYCDRYATTAFGDGQSVGLIGRLGLHDNDPVEWYSTPVVKNVAVDGIIYSRRSVGGIVGKTGQSDGVTIENCLNFATVQNTDSKGVGGIAGAGWNDATIRNCANFGYIYTSYSNAGGISGSCEANVINSYNFGYVGAPSNKIEQAQALGTNNYDAVWTNCYWLTGSSAAVVNPAVYGSTVGSTITEITAPANYKTAGFLTNLNAGSSSWMTGTTSNLSAGVVTALQSVHSLSSSLTSYDCMGVPVPSTF